jgi:BlaI family transcriptional regulator, penicillinase repressor
MDISNAEYEVMEAVWGGSPCSAQQVIDRLSDRKDWHEKTVKTLLNRLVKKQALATEPDGRRYLYRPLVAREELQRKESRQLLNRLFGGKVSPLVATFAQQNELDNEDMQALKKLITDWEHEHKERKDD